MTWTPTFFEQCRNQQPGVTQISHTSAIGKYSKSAMSLLVRKLHSRLGESMGSVARYGAQSMLGELPGNWIDVMEGAVTAAGPDRGEA